MKRQELPKEPVSPRRRLKLGALQDNLGYLSRVLRNVAVQSAEGFVGDLGFAAGQMTLLGLIAANEGVTQNELARVMLMRKSQVTALIQDLVARDFISREDHAADRRFNTLALTAAGQEIWQRTQGRMASHSEMLLAVLDEPERRELVRLLRKMLAGHLSEVDVDFNVTAA